VDVEAVFTGLRILDFCHDAHAAVDRVEFRFDLHLFTLSCL
jgi:hypothetical protein